MNKIYFSHWSHVNAVPLPKIPLKIKTEILLVLQDPDQMFTPLYSLSRTLPVLPHHYLMSRVLIVHLSDCMQNLQDFQDLLIVLYWQGQSAT